VSLEIVEGGVGKHHAKAEGVVGAVALIDNDLGIRPLLLQQDRGIETRRAATDIAIFMRASAASCLLTGPWEIF
jgi:hypothetical protein